MIRKTLFAAAWLALSTGAFAALPPELSLEERQARVAQAAQPDPADVSPRASVAVRLEVAYQYRYPGGSVQIVNAYPAREGVHVLRSGPFKPDFLPPRFLIGDGALDGRILSVDRSPGTPLARVLDELEHQILGLYGLASKSELWPETLTAFLAAQAQDYLDYPKEGALADPLAQVSAATWSSQRDLMAGLAGAPVGASSVALAGYGHPVRRFEEAIAARRGVCIDNVLLSSFVLERFGVAHRVVFGAVVAAHDEGRSSGHAWIELPSGQILDPTWKTLGMPHAHGDTHPDWSDFGNEIGMQPRFGYPYFPVSPF